MLSRDSSFPWIHVIWPGYQTICTFTRLNQHFMACAGGVVWPMDERFIFLWNYLFFSCEFWCKAFFLNSNSRDCCISDGVLVTACGVLTASSSSSWTEFDEIHYKWVLLTIVSRLWLYLQLRHKDTEMQRDKETQRRRDTETQRHRDTETQRHRTTKT